MVFGIITGTAHASSKLEITDPRAAKIEDIVELPIKGVRAVQSDGQIMFLSENGRFVISGQIYDLWSKKPLNPGCCSSAHQARGFCLSRSTSFLPGGWTQHPELESR
nr:disulfide isomerase DsbC N-terminal domain-containing protein [Escherichia coli]